MTLAENESKARALVADDDEMTRLLVRETLLGVGFDVVEAIDGRQAIELFDAVAPEIVFLDVQMPYHDGFEVCRHIQYAGGVPVVMVTALNDLESIRKAYESGATDFISKPINWPILGHRARYILRAARSARALRAAEGRNSAMLRAMPDMMFTVSGDGTYLDFHEGIDSVPFVPPAHFLGKKVADVMPPDVADLLSRNIRRAIDTGETQSVIYSLPDATGEHHYEARMVRAAPNEVVAVVRDITRQRQNEEKITRLAYYDSLTGMPNRQFFLERLERELQQARTEARKLAILFLDLDGFKRINDTLGHNAGDHLLQAVAERLREHLRATDIVSRASTGLPSIDFARLGGDEFTVILPHIADVTVAASVAERIQAIMSEPLNINGHEIVITSSVGVAIFPDDGQDAASLLKHADTAMYHAKDTGRNNWQFYRASLTTRAMQRLELENSIRKGIERGEFCLHYQPLVSAQDNVVCSVEALVRWNHPQRGLVTPAEFIPVAEESGLIVQLGEWVLRQTCLQVKMWQAAGLGSVRVSVNLSGRQLRDAGFVAMVLGILDETGVDGKTVNLELTESTLMDSGDAVLAGLRRLQDAGIGLSVDDFGTGYSSMAYLKRLPICTLKVDQSFVRGLPHSADDAAITTAIISMARSLKLDVVAEGVETPEQATFLRQAGCAKLQGYLFDRPMPPEKLEALLRTQLPADTQLA